MLVRRINVSRQFLKMNNIAHICILVIFLFISSPYCALSYINPEGKGTVRITPLYECPDSINKETTYYSIDTKNDSTNNKRLISKIKSDIKRINATDIKKEVAKYVNAKADRDTIVRRKRFWEKAKKLTYKFANYVSKADTNYIGRPAKDFTIMLGTRTINDFYVIRSADSDTKLNISNESSYGIGGYIYWKAIGIGGLITLNPLWNKGEKMGTRVFLKLNTSKIAGEAYLYNSSSKGKIYSDQLPSSINGSDFTGLKASAAGINAAYIFNNRKYSWSSAFGKSTTRQKKSAGSFKLGLSFEHHDIKMNTDKISEDVIANIDTTMLFNEVKYNDFCVTFGYGYNWVINKHWMLAAAATPAIGYRHMRKHISEEDTTPLNTFSFDLVANGAVKWSDRKYNIALTWDLHTSFYTEKSFSLANNIVSFRLLFGIVLF